MNPIRFTTLFLLLLNVAVVGLIVVLWNHGQGRVAEPQTLVVPPLPLPDLGALNSTPMHAVDVVTIRDQAVFYASRTFYRPPPAPTEVPVPDFDMSGTMRLADGKRIAFVRKKADRSSRTLHVGDDLEGWRVRVIEQDHVGIDYGEQSAELRGSKTSGVTGLIHAAGGPHIETVGIRVLGNGGAGFPRMSTQSPPLQARTFHPPPQAGK